ncbi:hypothetical protein AOQ84DRAFT_220342 [Glonium stellatum]|uniref:Uncharacterized protein n=1 Tax=Glonium stellatum TaxID=574774 RepID=A0A8E2JU92_9PEZI|nr:hypothetical protein AOQ84DRAFT_220342 [Glonium stellatum]
MITVTVCIVSISPPTSPSEFLQALRSSGISPLIIARVVQWIITPTIADHLLRHNWDFMLILAPETSLPKSVESLIAQIFSVQVEQPDEYPASLQKTNHTLLYPESVPPTFNLERPLLATSSQRVELTPSLLAFARSSFCPPGPVSMLNFLSFHPFASARAAYAAYIEAFKTSIGSKRGGTLKLLGNTVAKGEWDKVAMAQYPSLEYFADMMADPVY